MCAKGVVRVLLFPCLLCRGVRILLVGRDSSLSLVSRLREPQRDVASTLFGWDDLYAEDSIVFDLREGV